MRRDVHNFCQATFWRRLWVHQAGTWEMGVVVEWIEYHRFNSLHASILQPPTFHSNREWDEAFKNAGLDSFTWITFIFVLIKNYFLDGHDLIGYRLLKHSFLSSFNLRLKYRILIHIKGSAGENSLQFLTRFSCHYVIIFSFIKPFVQCVFIIWINLPFHKFQ